MSGFELRKSGAAEYLLDIFFPNVCPFCDKIIPWDIYCCDVCFDGASLIDKKAAEKLCPVCGKLICICGSGGIVFDRCISAGIYEDSVRTAVLSMKYRHDKNAAEIFAEMIYRRIIAEESEKYDIVTYVPMSSVKERRRGYNQAELLAEKLGARLGLPVRGDLLMHRYTKESQHDRSGEERRKAVLSEYFPMENAALSGENVLLCDDVLTTGSTMSRCAAILRDIGASRVTAAVCGTTIN